MASGCSAKSPSSSSPSSNRQTSSGHDVKLQKGKTRLNQNADQHQQTACLSLMRRTASNEIENTRREKHRQTPAITSTGQKEAIKKTGRRSHGVDVETSTALPPTSLVHFLSLAPHLIEDSSCIRMICHTRPRMRIELPSMMSYIKPHHGTIKATRETVT